MPIQNKNDLKNLSSTTYIDNTTGQITPASVRYFNDTLIDSLVDGVCHASLNTVGAKCVSMDTLVLTNKGLVEIGSLSTNRTADTFNPGDAILLDFVAFAGKRGITWPENKQKLSTDIFLSHTIKSYIADQIWGSQAYYRIFSGKDPCIRKALKLTY
jgi:hypothetical protein